MLIGYRNMNKYIIALDAGTTSVRAMLYDLEKDAFVFTAQQEVGQSYPQSGWVEQDANEIFYKAAYVLNACATACTGDIVGIGITNQRETIVLWNKETGEPVCPAIVWQCRRTAKFCEGIPSDMQGAIKSKTGLLCDAYFSASKIKWAIDNVPAVRELLKMGKLCVGTVDSYLLYKLSAGKIFSTDHTNASRTMLFNIHTLEWDRELLAYFGIPYEVLPEVHPSAYRLGEIPIGGKQVPVAGVAGDQQAALYGQACLDEGDAKVTYGTGLFLLFHTGNRCISSHSGLITTIGYSTEKKVAYALEGSAFNAGSAVQWLRDELGVITTSAESEALAVSVPDSGGVSFVPAFTGLGAPHWRGDARGLLCGLTRGTTRAHVVRAVLESIAFGARELVECMQSDSGIRFNEIKCDGGASANGFLMQFQADVLGLNVNRPAERESTALGAALLCAYALGLRSERDILRLRRSERVFVPQGDKGYYDALYAEYERAVRRTLLK